MLDPVPLTRRPGAVRDRPGRHVLRDLRRASAEGTIGIGFEAYAIGGLSVGEPIDVMYDIVEHTAPLLPADRPRYLMGVGTPDDLVECRGARHRHVRLRAADPKRPQRPALHADGRINIKNARYAEDERPSDEACRCYTCRTVFTGLSAPLFVAGEMTAATLNTLHNIQFYLDTMEAIREAISFGRFEDSDRIFTGPATASRSIHDPDVRFRRTSLVLAIGRASRRGCGQPVGPAHSVCARPRHLLLRHPAADAAAAEEGRRVPRRAEGRRQGRHDRRAVRQHHQARRRSRCSCRSPTRSASRSRARAIVGYQGQAPVRRSAP